MKDGGLLRDLSLASSLTVRHHSIWQAHEQLGGAGGIARSNSLSGSGSVSGLSAGKSGQ